MKNTPKEVEMYKTEGIVRIYYEAASTMDGERIATAITPEQKKFKELGRCIVVDEDAFAAYLAPIYEAEKEEYSFSLNTADYPSVKAMMIALGIKK